MRVLSSRIYVEFSLRHPALRISLIGIGSKLVEVLASYLPREGFSTMRSMTVEARIVTAMVAKGVVSIL